MKKKNENKNAKKSNNKNFFWKKIVPWLGITSGAFGSVASGVYLISKKSGLESKKRNQEFLDQININSEIFKKELINFFNFNLNKMSINNLYNDFSPKQRIKYGNKYIILKSWNKIISHDGEVEIPNLILEHGNNANLVSRKITSLKIKGFKTFDQLAMDKLTEDIKEKYVAKFFQNISFENPASHFLNPVKQFVIKQDIIENEKYEFAFTKWDIDSNGIISYTATFKKGKEISNYENHLVNFITENDYQKKEAKMLANKMHDVTLDIDQNFSQKTIIAQIKEKQMHQIFKHQDVKIIFDNHYLKDDQIHHLKVGVKHPNGEIANTKILVIVPKSTKTIINEKMNLIKSLKLQNEVRLIEGGNAKIDKSYQVLEKQFLEIQKNVNSDLTIDVLNDQLKILESIKIQIEKNNNIIKDANRDFQTILGINIVNIKQIDNINVDITKEVKNYSSIIFSQKTINNVSIKLKNNSIVYNNDLGKLSYVVELTNNNQKRDLTISYSGFSSVTIRDKQRAKAIFQSLQSPSEVFLQKGAIASLKQDVFKNAWKKFQMIKNTDLIFIKTSEEINFLSKQLRTLIVIMEDYNHSINQSNQKHHATIINNKNLINQEMAKFHDVVLDKDSDISNIILTIKNQLNKNWNKKVMVTSNSQLLPNNTTQEVKLTFEVGVGNYQIVEHKTIKVKAFTTTSMDNTKDINDLMTKFINTTLSKDVVPNLDEVEKQLNIKDKRGIKVSTSSILKPNGKAQNFKLTFTKGAIIKFKTIQVTVPTTNIIDQKAVTDLANKFVDVFLDKDTPISTNLEILEAIKAKQTNKEAKSSKFTINVNSFNLNGRSGSKRVIIEVTLNGKKATKEINVTVPTTTLFDEIIKLKTIQAPSKINFIGNVSPIDTYTLAKKTFNNALKVNDNLNNVKKAIIEAEYQVKVMKDYNVAVSTANTNYNVIKDIDQDAIKLLDGILVSKVLPNTVSKPDTTSWNIVGKSGLIFAISTYTPNNTNGTIDYQVTITKGNQTVTINVNYSGFKTTADQTLENEIKKLKAISKPSKTQFNGSVAPFDTFTNASRAFDIAIAVNDNLANVQNAIIEANKQVKVMEDYNVAVLTANTNYNVIKDIDQDAIKLLDGILVSKVLPNTVSKPDTTSWNIVGKSGLIFAISTYTPNNTNGTIDYQVTITKGNQTLTIDVNYSGFKTTADQTLENEIKKLKAISKPSKTQFNGSVAPFDTFTNASKAFDIAIAVNDNLANVQNAIIEANKQVKVMENYNVAVLTANTNYNVIKDIDQGAIKLLDGILVSKVLPNTVSKPDTTSWNIAGKSWLTFAISTYTPNNTNGTIDYQVTTTKGNQTLTIDVNYSGFKTTADQTLENEIKKLKAISKPSQTQFNGSVAPLDTFTNALTAFEIAIAVNDNLANVQKAIIEAKKQVKVMKDYNAAVLTANTNYNVIKDIDQGAIELLDGILVSKVLPNTFSQPDTTSWNIAGKSWLTFAISTYTPNNTNGTIDYQVTITKGNQTVTINVNYSGFKTTADQTLENEIKKLKAISKPSQTQFNGSVAPLDTFTNALTAFETAIAVNDNLANVQKAIIEAKYQVKVMEDYNAAVLTANTNYNVIKDIDQGAIELLDGILVSKVLPNTFSQPDTTSWNIAGKSGLAFAISNYAPNNTNGTITYKVTITNGNQTVTINVNYSGFKTTADQTLENEIKKLKAISKPSQTQFNGSVAPLDTFTNALTAFETAIAVNDNLANVQKAIIEAKYQVKVMEDYNAAVLTANTNYNVIKDIDQGAIKLLDGISISKVLPNTVSKPDTTSWNIAGKSGLIFAISTYTPNNTNGTIDYQVTITKGNQTVTINVNYSGFKTTADQTLENEIKKLKAISKPSQTQFNGSVAPLDTFTNASKAFDIAIAVNDNLANVQNAIIKANKQVKVMEGYNVAVLTANTNYNVIKDIDQGAIKLLDGILVSKVLPNTVSQPDTTSWNIASKSGLTFAISTYTPNNTNGTIDYQVTITKGNQTLTIDVNYSGFKTTADQTLENEIKKLKAISKPSKTQFNGSVAPSDTFTNASRAFDIAIAVNDNLANVQNAIIKANKQVKVMEDYNAAVLTANTNYNVIKDIDQGAIKLLDGILVSKVLPNTVSQPDTTSWNIASKSGLIFAISTYTPNNTNGTIDYQVTITKGNQTVTINVNYSGFKTTADQTLENEIKKLKAISKPSQTQFNGSVAPLDTFTNALTAFETAIAVNDNLANVQKAIIEANKQVKVMEDYNVEVLTANTNYNVIKDIDQGAIKLLDGILVSKVLPNTVSKPDTTSWNIAGKSGLIFAISTYTPNNTNGTITYKVTITNGNQTVIIDVNYSGFKTTADQTLENEIKKLKAISKPSQTQFNGSVAPFDTFTNASRAFDIAIAVNDNLANVQNAIIEANKQVKVMEDYNVEVLTANTNYNVIKDIDQDAIKLLDGILVSKVLPNTVSQPDTTSWNIASKSGLTFAISNYAPNNTNGTIDYQVTITKGNQTVTINVNYSGFKTTADQTLENEIKKLKAISKPSQTQFNGSVAPFDTFTNASRAFDIAIAVNDNLANVQNAIIEANKQVKVMKDYNVEVLTANTNYNVIKDIDQGAIKLLDGILVSKVLPNTVSKPDTTSWNIAGKSGLTFAISNYTPNNTNGTITYKVTITKGNQTLTIDVNYSGFKTNVARLKEALAQISLISKETLAPGATAPNDVYNSERQNFENAQKKGQAATNISAVQTQIDIANAANQAITNYNKLVVSANKYHEGELKRLLDLKIDSEIALDQGANKPFGNDYSSLKSQFETFQNNKTTATINEIKTAIIKATAIQKEIVDYNNKVIKSNSNWAKMKAITSLEIKALDNINSSKDIKASEVDDVVFSNNQTIKGLSNIKIMLKGSIVKDDINGIYSYVVIISHMGGQNREIEVKYNAEFKTIQTILNESNESIKISNELREKADVSQASWLAQTKEFENFSSNKGIEVLMPEIKDLDGVTIIWDKTIPYDNEGRIDYQYTLIYKNIKSNPKTISILNLKKQQIFIESSNWIISQMKEGVSRIKKSKGSDSHYIYDGEIIDAKSIYGEIFNGFDSVYLDWKWDWLSKKEHTNSPELSYKTNLEIKDSNQTSIVFTIMINSPNSFIKKREFSFTVDIKKRINKKIANGLIKKFINVKLLKDDKVSSKQNIINALKKVIHPDLKNTSFIIDVNSLKTNNNAQAVIITLNYEGEIATKTIYITVPTTTLMDNTKDIDTLMNEFISTTLNKDASPTLNELERQLNIKDKKGINVISHSNLKPNGKSQNFKLIFTKGTITKSKTIQVIVPTTTLLDKIAQLNAIQAPSKIDFLGAIVLADNYTPARIAFNKALKINDTLTNVKKAIIEATYQVKIMNEYNNKVIKENNNWNLIGGITIKQIKAIDNITTNVNQNAISIKNINLSQFVLNKISVKVKPNSLIIDNDAGTIKYQITLTLDNQTKELTIEYSGFKTNVARLKEALAQISLISKEVLTPGATAPNDVYNIEKQNFENAQKKGQTATNLSAVQAQIDIANAANQAITDYNKSVVSANNHHQTELNKLLDLKIDNEIALDQGANKPLGNDYLNLKSQFEAFQNNKTAATIAEIQLAITGAKEIKTKVQTWNNKIVAANKNWGLVNNITIAQIKAIDKITPNINLDASSIKNINLSQFVLNKISVKVKPNSLIIDNDAGTIKYQVTLTLSNQTKELTIEYSGFKTNVARLKEALAQISLISKEALTPGATAPNDVYDAEKQSFKNAQKKGQLATTISAVQAQVDIANAANQAITDYNKLVVSANNHHQTELNKLLDLKIDNEIALDQGANKPLGNDYSNLKSQFEAFQNNKTTATIAEIQLAITSAKEIKTKVQTWNNKIVAANKNWGLVNNITIAQIKAIDKITPNINLDASSIKNINLSQFVLNKISVKVKPNSLIIDNDAGTIKYQVTLTLSNQTKELTIEYSGFKTNVARLKEALAQISLISKKTLAPGATAPNDVYNVEKQNFENAQKKGQLATTISTVQAQVDIANAANQAITDYNNKVIKSNSNWAKMNAITSLEIKALDNINSSKDVKASDVDDVVFSNNQTIKGLSNIKIMLKGSIVKDDINGTYSYVVIISHMGGQNREIEVKYNAEFKTIQTILNESNESIKISNELRKKADISQASWLAQTKEFKNFSSDKGIKVLMPEIKDLDGVKIIWDKTIPNDNEGRIDYQYTLTYKNIKSNPKTISILNLKKEELIIKRAKHIYWKIVDGIDRIKRQTGSNPHYIYDGKIVDSRSIYQNIFNGFDNVNLNWSWQWLIKQNHTNSPELTYKTTLDIKNSNQTSIVFTIMTHSPNSFIKTEKFAFTVDIKKRINKKNANELVNKFQDVKLLKDDKVSSKQDVINALKKVIHPDLRNTSFIVNVDSLKTNNKAQPVIITLDYENEIVTKKIFITVPTTNAMDQSVADDLVAKFDDKVTLIKDDSVSSNQSIINSIKKVLTNNEAKISNFTINVSSLKTDDSFQKIIITLKHPNGKTSKKTIQVKVPTTNAMDQSVADDLVAKFDDKVTLIKDDSVSSNQSIINSLKKVLTNNEVKISNFTINVSSLKTDDSFQKIIITLKHPNGKTSKKTIQVKVPTTNAMDQKEADDLVAKFDDKVTLIKDDSVSSDQSIINSLKKVLTNNEAKISNFTISVSSLKTDGSFQKIIITLKHPNGKTSKKTIQVKVPTTNAMDQEEAKKLIKQFDDFIHLDKNVLPTSKNNIIKGIKKALKNPIFKGMDFDINVNVLIPNGKYQKVLITIKHPNGKYASKIVDVDVPLLNAKKMKLWMNEIKKIV